MKPHSLFALLLIAVSVLAISLTGASSASRTESGLTVSSSIDGSKLDDNMTLSGQVTWTASSGGTPDRIEFLIDGSSKWTDPTAPYQFGGDPAGRFDTTSLPDGQHKLTVKAYRDAGNNHATSHVGDGDDRQRQEPVARRPSAATAAVVLRRHLEHRQRRHAHRLADVDRHAERNDRQLGRLPDRRHREVDREHHLPTCSTETAAQARHDDAEQRRAHARSPGPRRRRSDGHHQQRGHGRQRRDATATVRPPSSSPRASPTAPRSPAP